MDCLVASASQALSSVTRLAGVVTVPRQSHPSLSQIEFVNLSDRRVLVILVVNVREVHNRVLQMERHYRPDALRRAASYLNEQLAALSRGDLKSRCKFFLLQQLTSGDPSEEVLANQVGMSGRSLQRKLAEAGLTYGQVLAETRYELAQRYLDDPNRSVTEITFLLGFSEHSAFTRAFKRWSGMAPTSYRADRAALH